MQAPFPMCKIASAMQDQGPERHVGSRSGPLARYIVLRKSNFEDTRTFPSGEGGSRSETDEGRAQNRRRKN